MKLGRIGIIVAIAPLAVFCLSVFAVKEELPSVHAALNSPKMKIPDAGILPHLTLVAIIIDDIEREVILSPTSSGASQSWKLPTNS